MMKMTDGTCAGCGQMLLVSVDPEKPDQVVEANRAATRKCGCEESKTIVAEWNLRDQVKTICGSASRSKGFTELSIDQTDAVMTAALAVHNELLDKMTITVEGDTIAIARKGNKTSVTRKKAVEIGGAS